MFWPPLPPSPGGSAPQARLLCWSTSPWRMITGTRSANLWISPHRSPQADYHRAGATWAAASQKRAISAITKRQWGAFYGTELDLQLRRRGIRTIVLGGIATNFGVESTARQAWEHSYELVLVEDATASTSAELHDFAIRFILPRIARVTQTSDIGFATA